MKKKTLLDYINVHSQGVMSFKSSLNIVEKKNNSLNSAALVSIIIEWSNSINVITLL